MSDGHGRRGDQALRVLAKQHGCGFLAAEPARVVIEVRDSSPGMTSEQLRLLQHHETGNAGHESLYGLGLEITLSRILVKLHGGEMWVNSEKGKGNTFGFSLPLKQPRIQTKERKPGK